MKISVDDKELFTLSDVQKKVIKNDINEDIFDEYMKRRLSYVLQHKYDQSFKRLKDEWEPKLAESGVVMIPTNKDDFAKLVFSHPDYTDRKKRESSRNV